MLKMMNSKIRHFLCVVISVLFVMQMFIILSSALPMTEIHESDSIKVTLSAGESKIFVFRPIRSAKLDFYSTGKFDTHFYLYDDEEQLGGKTNKDKKENSIASDDDGGDGSNFKMNYSFYNGDTYYFEVLFADEDQAGSFTVTLGEAHSCIDSDKNGLCDICGKEFVCEHKSTKVSGEKKADCVNNGYTGDTVCLECGAVLKPGSVISALGHVQGQWITISEATPEKDGVEELRCTRCSVVLETRTFTHTHDFELVKTVKPNCTQDGYTEYRCKTCSFVKKENVIKANGHTEKTTEEAASCTQAGGRKTVCTVCGAVLSEEAYPALGHDFSAWDIIKNPTCTEAGEKINVCVRCGEEKGGKVEIPANGHSFPGYTFTEEPTCTESGEKVSVCKVCGEKKTETVEAYGHLFTEWETTKVATCTETGVRTRTCTRCGEKQSEEVSQTHSFTEWETVKEAACNEKGEKVRKCTLCGYEEKEIIEYGHSYGQWNVTEPTCTKSGMKTRTCSLCGNTETETAEALGHSFGEWAQTKAASCSANGEEKRICSRCGEEETRSIAMTQHIFSQWETLCVSTCTANGKRERKCSVCGLVEREILPIESHNFTQKVVKATTKSNGKIINACSVCGLVKGEETVKKIDSKTVVLSKTVYTYDAKGHKPKLEIKDSSGKTLKVNEDYKVSGLNSQKAMGTYTVKVKFTGSYSGSETLKFSIKPGKVSGLSYKSNTSAVKVSWKAVKGATGYRIFKYNPKTKAYEKMGDTSKTYYTVKKLDSAVKYSFTVQPFSKTSDKGTVWASDRVKVTAFTAPSVPKVTLKAGNDKITVKMSKQDGIKGYEIYVKTGENGKYKKAATTAYTSKTVKASSGKTSYVKVRAYRMADGKRLYSSYSAAKKVKVK